MKCIQIQKTLLLSLLFSTSLFARTTDRIEYALGRVLKDVEQLVINGKRLYLPNYSSNFVSGVYYRFLNSGAYCVTENLYRIDCYCRK